MNINDYLIKDKHEQLTKKHHPYNKDSLKLVHPEKTKILIVGTFPPEFKSGETSKDKKGRIYPEVKWYYGSRLNRFWGIISEVFNQPDLIKGNEEYKRRFTKKKKIAFLDVFQTIWRYNNSSSDSNIYPCEIIDFNLILKKYPKIQAIIATSKWVKNILNAQGIQDYKDDGSGGKLFEVISPSNARRVEFEEKVEEYRKIFQKIDKKFRIWEHQ